MSSKLSNYLPCSYVKHQYENISIYHSKCTNGNEINTLHSWFLQSLNYFKQVYCFNDSYKINICSFNSVNDAYEVLDRRLSETALMVPYANEQEALIICFSSLLNKRNNDQNRMVKQFAHEICHIATNIEAGFTRKLGNKNNHFPVWLGEAIAEYYSSLVLDNINKINDSIEYYKVNDINLGLDSLFDSYLAQITKDIDGYKYALGKFSYFILQNNIDVLKFDRTLNEVIRKFT